MEFQRKNWKNRIAEFPGRIQAQPVDGEQNQFDITRCDGLADVEGDKLDAAGMNDLEARIAGADAALNNGLDNLADTVQKGFARERTTSEQELAEAKEEAENKYLQFDYAGNGTIGRIAPRDKNGTGLLRVGGASPGSGLLPYSADNALGHGVIGSAGAPFREVYAKQFSGNIKGNVQGNVTGNVTGDITGNVKGNVVGNLDGNAKTATKLAKAVTINNVPFDGSGNITIDTGKVDLSGYATQQWVEGKGYATEQWVNGKSYTTKAYVDGSLQNKANAGKYEHLSPVFPSGMQNVGTYFWADDNSRMHLRIHIRKTTGNLYHMDTVCIMPVGFRPQELFIGYGYAVGQNVSQPRHMAAVMAIATGEIQLWMVGDGYAYHDKCNEILGIFTCDV